MSSWPKQQVVEVVENIVAILHGEGEVGVSNSTIVIENSDAMVIDTMTFPEMALGISEQIKRRGATVNAVINTHHHIDHVGGNKAFADAHIVSHPETVATMKKVGLPAKDYDILMPKFRGRFADLDFVIPEPILDEFIPLCEGKFIVFEAAHTSSDVTLWFPKSRVLIAGDISFVRVTPLAVSGLISGWIEAIDAILALNPATIIPGHGPLGTVQDLLTMKNYLSSLLDLGQHVLTDGISIEEALVDFDAGPVSEWLEPERTSINLERSIQEIQGEISKNNLSLLPPTLRYK